MLSYPHSLLTHMHTHSLSPYSETGHSCMINIVPHSAETHIYSTIIHSAQCHFPAAVSSELFSSSQTDVLPQVKGIHQLLAECPIRRQTHQQAPPNTSACIMMSDGRQRASSKVRQPSCHLYTGVKLNCVFFFFLNRTKNYIKIIIVRADVVKIVLVFQLNKLSPILCIIFHMNSIIIPTQSLAEHRFLILIEALLCDFLPTHT